MWAECVCGEHGWQVVTDSWKQQQHNNNVEVVLKWRPFNWEQVGWMSGLRDSLLVVLCDWHVEISRGCFKLSLGVVSVVKGQVWVCWGKGSEKDEQMLHAWKENPFASMHLIYFKRVLIFYFCIALQPEIVWHFWHVLKYKMMCQTLEFWYDRFQRE